MNPYGLMDPFKGILMDPFRGTLKGSLILGSNFGRLGANRAAATTEGTPLSPGLHRKRRPGPEKSGDLGVYGFRV